MLRLVDPTKHFPDPTIEELNRPPLGSIASRVDAIKWLRVDSTLATRPYALLPKLLTEQECARLVEMYGQDQRFRSRVVMERYAFGKGEYKYFDYPLPDIVQELRASLYRHLWPIANHWHAALSLEERFPATHREFVDICGASGQRRPTPLMLTYAQDDYCCLHQDLYGDHVFPFQVIFMLSNPDRDFAGGELLLTEAAPKKPTKVEVVHLNVGQAVLVPVNFRPVFTERGAYRANVRHGVSKLRSGARNTMGIIFHDAK
jgi:uncharacterized protein